MKVFDAGVVFSNCALNISRDTISGKDRILFLLLLSSQWNTIKVMGGGSFFFLLFPLLAKRRNSKKKERRYVPFICGIVNG